MISFKDFEKEDGKIDWNALRKAKIEAGESCHKCNSMIFPAKGCYALCCKCECLNKDDAVDHNYFVRCPSCSATFSPFESDNYNNFNSC